VGDGFFTMKHNVTNVRQELNRLYEEYDALAIYKVVYDEIDRLN